MAEEEVKTFEVEFLQGTDIAEDRSYLIHRAATPSKKMLGLEMSPETLAQWVTRLTEVHSALQIESGHKSGVHAVQAFDAQVIQAKAPVGIGKVVLSIRTDNQLIQHFAITPDQASRLRAALEREEKVARENAKKTWQ